MVREIAKLSTIPVTTMGGITMDNAADVIRAGADHVAVVTAITKAPDIAKAARELVTLVESARKGARA